MKNVLRYCLFSIAAVVTIPVHSESTGGTGQPYGPGHVPAENSEGTGTPQLNLQLLINNKPWTMPAENSGGTGKPQPYPDLRDEPPIVPAEDGGGTGQRILLSFKDEQQLIVGSASLVRGYSMLHLDAFGTQQSQSDWGHAEVLLGCHQADVLVYQNIDGQAVEVFATQIAIDSCAQ